VPHQDWYSFARWGAELRYETRTTLRASAVHQTVDALHAYVDVMIAERCAHRTDDLVSALISAEIDGLAFTTDELHLAVTTLVTMASAYESSSPAG
jgi:cytochrome P450